MKNDAGFTLIELIVTVAVVAVLLTVGVPELRETINNNRLTANANAFVAAMNLARSEAIKRNVRVTLCKSANGLCCVTGGSSGYEQGWIVFADPNGDALRDPATCSTDPPPNPNPEPLIRAYEPLAAGVTLQGNGLAVDYISFVPAGVAQTAGGVPQFATMSLCKSGYATSSRQIALSRGGRARITKVSPSDSEWNCP
ncbi:MAG: GspH/FimT family protein [Candidatus Contendobacter sp.]|nr:GspH/FimT family protein [Candidatus Contendobacter sp.]